MVAGGRSGRWHLSCIVLWHGALRRHSSGGSTESPVSTVMPLPGILPGGLGVSSSGPWRCTGVDVLYVVDTRSCPGSLQDPVGSPVVPGGFLGDSVVVVSALSSVLWSLLWLGLRVTAALGGSRFRYSSRWESLSFRLLPRVVAVWASALPRCRPICGSAPSVWLAFPLFRVSASGRLWRPQRVVRPSRPVSSDVFLDWWPSGSHWSVGV